MASKMLVAILRDNQHELVFFLAKAQRKSRAEALPMGREPQFGFHAKAQRF